MPSTQNHCAAGQPVGFLGPSPFPTETNASRHPIVIDHFALYLFNNIQLPPYLLEQAALVLTGRTNG
jgi:hypothetical protein